MKKILKKYRSIVVIGAALAFNLISSLLVCHPDGKSFNLYPMTVTEWVCDIITIIGFFTGLAMLLFDVNVDTKNKIKEALLETNKELKSNPDAVMHVKKNQ